MVRDTVTVQNLTGGQTNALAEITFTASDAVNFEQVAWQDGLILCFRNSSADTAYDVTLESAPDTLGRDVDVVQEIAAGDTYCTRIVGANGFRQSDGYVHFKAENAAVLYAAIKVR
jgi:hypothetical protein